MRMPSWTAVPEATSEDWRERRASAAMISWPVVEGCTPSERRKRAARTEGSVGTVRGRVGGGLGELVLGEVLLEFRLEGGRVEEDDAEVLVLREHRGPDLLDGGIDGGGVGGGGLLLEVGEQPVVGHIAGC